jgi:hypothetical protein
MAVRRRLVAVFYGFAMIKSDTVDGWVRLGSKRIADQLEPELTC